MDIRRILIGGQLALRAAVGGTMAYYLATFLNLQHPLYALVATIIVTDFSPSETRRLGGQRLTATAFGAFCGVSLSMVFDPSPWLAGFGILAAMVLSHACNADAGSKVAGYICAIIIFSSGSTPWVHALHRVVETVLGIAVGWLLSLIPRIVKLNSPDGRDD
jgi:uncharacterized membrane protein YgaE (UPF0421/DUF939 family)